MLCKSTVMINSAVEAFVRNGGKIEVMPSFEFKPLPPRQAVAPAVDVPAKKKNRRVPIIDRREIEALQDRIIKSGHIKRIIAMARLGLSVIQISNRINVPRNVIVSLSVRLGFDVAEKANSSRIIKHKANTL